MSNGSKQAAEWQNDVGGLFLISVLALFMELLLIRWISTEINIFAYLQNTVLIVCFMGLGVGCLTCRRPVVFRNAAACLFTLVLVLTIPFTRNFLRLISLFLSTLGDLVVWQMLILNHKAETTLSVFAGLLATFVLMLLIWEIFVPIGRLLGRLLDEHPRPIFAYSVNIAGSIIGIWLFVLLSVLYQPPGTWFLVVVALLFFFIRPQRSNRLVTLALLFGTLVLSWFAGHEPTAVEVLWSPYQKLVLLHGDPNRFDRYVLKVNNSLYQWIVDLRQKAFHESRDSSNSPMKVFNQYNLPFILHPKAQTSLIVGSGTGNDVAGALRAGLKRVTAIEIDPAIIYFGRRYHPEKPYASSRVTIINDDARSFFATSKDRYDVIAFGLLDSHTTTAMTNARLDHYVYTKESLERAKTLLNDGGIVTLTFEAQKPFIADRIARSLREIFSEDPIVFRIPRSPYGIGGVMFIAGNLRGVRKTIAENKLLSSLLAKWSEEYPLTLTYTTKVITDDWPYLYLRSPQIPLLFYLLALMTFALFLYTRWRFKLKDALSGWDKSHWHFFFLGAAFLLLEVQNISKSAVVLGNTWWVNAVIISAILIMILLANLLAAKFPNFPLWRVYLGLISSCLVLYFIDLARFAFLPYNEKVAIVGMLTALPVLFSGLIFIRSFESAAHKDTALGANLFGSLVGGLLQSVTFITGIKALLLIVAMLYIAAMVCDLKLTENIGQRGDLGHDFGLFSPIGMISKWRRTFTAGNHGSPRRRSRLSK